MFVPDFRIDSLSKQNLCAKTDWNTFSKRGLEIYINAKFVVTISGVAIQVVSAADFPGGNLFRKSRSTSVN